ncbi:hypothetical protein ACXR0O_16485 [Verrucomicrobiota bacterium sgz303538]
MHRLKDNITAIRSAFPSEGLFAEKEWQISPEPFFIDEKLDEQLQKLGYRLNLFNRACNQLYYLSIIGKQPAWIADYVDRGKPPELVEYSRQKRFRDDLPRVIRPDLILTEEGFTISELDTVPGGIGLTAWLNHTYTPLGYDVIGGATGMIDGFHTAIGDADILVSKEAETYRPEMQWISRETGGALRVFEAETYDPQSSARHNPQPVYRFFELFDLPNIPGIPALMNAAAEGSVTITPPFKPYLEEKLWFALFWMRPLRDFWRRELSERHFLELQKHIPYTWILDPAPLPQHAVIPGLEINSWEELKQFSQKQRDLVLKISGFSELGWGARSVVIGSDQPQGEWRAAVEEALDSFGSNPYILQRFHKGRIVEQRFLDNTTGDIETMRGRVRLSPYYFLIEGKAALRGALATVCPADKKILHGMKDAIIVPTAVHS